MEGQIIEFYNLTLSARGVRSLYSRSHEREQEAFSLSRSNSFDVGQVAPIFLHSLTSIHSFLLMRSFSLLQWSLSKCNPTNYPLPTNCKLNSLFCPLYDICPIQEHNKCFNFLMVYTFACLQVTSN